MSPIDTFLCKWERSGGSELGSSQLFITDLCKLIGVEPPNPPRAEVQDNAYVFEKAVRRVSSTGRKSTARIDLYKRGHFIWESKQGSAKPAPKSQERRRRGTAIRDTPAWDKAILKARIQAVDYANLLPLNEQLPPFIMVSDIAHSIDVYADFKNIGEYLPFPSASTNRISLQDLRKPEVQALLRTIWTDSLSLDPSRESEKVTRALALQLFRIAESFEKKGYDPDETSLFIQRCVFMMFAEDSNLLPHNSFTQALAELQARPNAFAFAINELWKIMYTGGMSTTLGEQVLQFNSSFFENAKALPLDVEQIALLHQAALANWAAVDTSIFGALLEHTLSPKERHKLGAHYTPTIYVNRLVIPTIIEPERERWEHAKDVALDFVLQGNQEAAIAEIEKYYKHLTEVIVLDPSCGSGNFLAVALVLLKNIEDEVVEALKTLGLSTREIQNKGYTIKPQQFRGIEVVQRAADISELVLWISYLQQHFRIHGNIAPKEPILQDFDLVENRDAVLAWDSIEMHQDGIITYIHPRPADPWPKATYIVGNPPYVGSSRMRTALGDAYVDALRNAYPDVPGNIDYVMLWWHRAAILARAGDIERFGLITTNTIRQTFNRQIVEQHVNPQSNLAILFAIPDHPWYSPRDGGAAVRVAMTVCGISEKQGVLSEVILEQADGDYTQVQVETRTGTINTNLTIGADTTQLSELKANADLYSRGMLLSAKGFAVTSEQAKALGFGSALGLEHHIRPYLNGSDLVRTSRNMMVIDLYGLTIEEVQQRYPLVYQWILTHVKPQRDEQKNAVLRERWWLFESSRVAFRDASQNLERYIATPETSKHSGIFTFLNHEILPDNKLVTISSDDAYVLGILSSKIHRTWAIATGGKLGAGYMYTSICFKAFPFPIATDKQKERIRTIATQIDTHRKQRQKQHPALILTDIYNVIELMYNSAKLEPNDQIISDQGDLPTLFNLHNKLDVAVAEAYDWPLNLTTDAVLGKLVELNKERAVEEKAGEIRWLREEYQSGL